MYAQLVDTGLKQLRSSADMSAEEQAFQSRNDAGVKI